MLTDDQLIDRLRGVMEEETEDLQPPADLAARVRREVRITGGLGRGRGGRRPRLRFGDLFAVAGALCGGGAGAGGGARSAPAPADRGAGAGARAGCGHGHAVAGGRDLSAGRAPAHRGRGPGDRRQRPGGRARARSPGRAAVGNADVRHHAGRDVHPGRPRPGRRARGDRDRRRRSRRRALPCAGAQRRDERQLQPDRRPRPRLRQRGVTDRGGQRGDRRHGERVVPRGCRRTAPGPLPGRRRTPAGLRPAWARGQRGDRA